MRRGAALPVVLLALTMTSALAVGGAFISRQSVASARLASRGAGLQPAAERALVDAIAAWDSVGRRMQAIGTTEELPQTTSGGVITSAWTTRTSETLYWIVAESRSESRPALHRRMGVVVWFAGGAPAIAFPRGWGELP